MGAQGLPAGFRSFVWGFLGFDADVGVQAEVVKEPKHQHLIGLGVLQSSVLAWVIRCKWLRCWSAHGSMGSVRQHILGSKSN